MYKSVLMIKYMIGTVISGQRMCEPKDLEPDFRPSSKFIKIMTFETGGEYWSSLKRLTLLFELVNYVGTFLKGYKAPLSHVPLSFDLIHESLQQFSLKIGVVDAAKTSLLHRSNTIKCDVHFLAVVLDPLVPNTSSNAVQVLFEYNGFNASKRNAFEKCCDWLSLPPDYRKKGNDDFQMVVADRGTVIKRCGEHSVAYHT